jgi:hypothetical protein
MPSPAATQAAVRLWTQSTPPFPVRLSYRSSVEITRTLWWQTRFTRGRVREWRGGHNSVTVQNRTHVYMNFLDHIDIGNHLLQLCPKVVKHPVYPILSFAFCVLRVLHFTTLIVARLCSTEWQGDWWMMNIKGMEGTGHEFSWRDWRISRKSSVRIADVEAEIRTECLPNTNLQRDLSLSGI